jgi:hypothetical protein
MGTLRTVIVLGGVAVGVYVLTTSLSAKKEPDVTSPKVAEVVQEVIDRGFKSEGVIKTEPDENGQPGRLTIQVVVGDASMKVFKSSCTVKLLWRSPKSFTLLGEKDAELLQNASNATALLLPRFQGCKENLEYQPPPT